MAPGAHNVQSARFDDGVVVGLVGAAQADIGTAASHLCGDRDRLERTGLGDDAGFFGIVLGVQHDSRNPRTHQTVMQCLGFGDIVRAHQHRLPGGMDLGDMRDDRVVLTRLGDVHAVGLIFANVGGVGRDRRDTQLVELPQLLTGRQGGAGHSADTRVAVDECLHGDGVENLTGVGGFDSLLGFDSCLQAIGPALQRGDASTRGVDEVHGAITHDVVHVALQEHMCVQGHIDLGEGGPDVVLGVQVDVPQLLFQLPGSGIGQEDVATVVIGLVVLACDQLTDRLDDLRARRFTVAGSSQHQRHQSLVDEHRVGLVDDGDVGARRDKGIDIDRQLVAQHVETDLVDRPVGDVTGVGLTAFVSGGFLGDPAHRQPQALQERSHPLGITTGQVVVDRDDVHTASAQRVAGGGDRTGQSLTLTGGHLDDVAVEHAQGAQQLNIERALVNGPLGGLTHYRQELADVLGFDALGQVEFLGRLGELFVGEVLGLLVVLLRGIHELQRLALVLVGGGTEELPELPGEP